MSDREFSKIKILSWGVTALVVFSVLSLAQAVGRLIGYEERWSRTLWVTVFALLLAGLNLFLIYRLAQSTARKLSIAIYTIAICAASVGLAAWSYKQTPDLLFEKIAVDVKILDREGSSGRIQSEINFKVLENERRDLWWRDLGSEGQVKNLSFRTSNVPSTSKFVNEAGFIQARLEFNPPVRRGQLVDAVLAFDVVNSPPDDKVYFVIPVEEPTKYIQMVITVPSERPCKSAEANSHSSAGVELDRLPENVPILSSDNTVLSWRRKEPEIGRSYVLTCHW